VSVPEPTQTARFDALKLAEPIAKAVAALGYEEPTPIQREAIPILLAGRDLIGQAGTGTGKTAAFSLPLLHQLMTTPAANKAAVRGLVLVPTRELAMQVAEAIHKYARGSKLSVLPLYGGAPMHQQIRSLERGASIVVATPGRALDHIRRTTLALGKLQILVLDEADEMLDMGFAEDLDAILEATPKARQTALFSATMPPRILSIANRHLNDPARIAIAREKTAAGKMPRVRQVAYIVARPHKAAALERVLETENASSALVFCRTRLEVDTLVETLNAHGHSAEALHGGMEQRARDRVMSKFREGKADLLVATDVAARGLDIERLSHVINYDVPNSSETYLHRIGRTGRAGREGTAITLVEPREHRLLRSMEAVTKQRIEVAPVPTVADLRARRLELTRASLRESLLAGGLDPYRVIVESLAEEFDALDVAAAAVKLADPTAESGSAGDEHEIPPVAAPPEPRGRGSKRGPEPRPGRREARGDGGGDDGVKIFVGAGRNAGVRPGDLVGAIVNEANVAARDVGSIQISERFSLVEVPEPIAEDVIRVLRASGIRGKKVNVRRERVR